MNPTLVADAMSSMCCEEEMFTQPTVTSQRVAPHMHRKVTSLCELKTVTLSENIVIICHFFNIAPRLYIYFKYIKMISA